MGRERRVKQWLTRHRRLLLAGGLVIGICFLAGLLGSTQLPKVKAFVLVRIEHFSREHLPVRILPASVDVSFVPLGARLTKVAIVPKPGMTDLPLENASFDDIRVTISPIQLLRGKIRLTSLEITGARIFATLKPTKKRDGPPLTGLFEMLGQVPVNLLELKDVSARLKLLDPEMTVLIENVELSAEKRRGNSFSLDIASAAVQTLSKGTGSPASLRIEIEGSTVLARTGVKLKSLSIRRGDSSLKADGEAEGDVEALDFNEAKVNLETDLNVESLWNWAKKNYPDELGRLETFAGRARIHGVYTREKGKMPDASFKAGLDGFRYGKFLLGRYETEGKYVQPERAEKAHEIRMKKITVDHPSGPMSLNDAVVRLSPESKTVSASLSAPNMQVHELLKALGIGEIPVWLQVSGEVPCGGTLAPEFKLTCQGKLKGDNLLIRDSMKSKGTIAAIRTFSAAGDVTIDKHKVSYAAELAMPDSKGRSQGTIDYDHGFKIAYEGDRVSLKDVASVADLKMDGTLKIKGSTEGNAHSATLSLDAEGADFWLEDFWLGNVKGQVAYKAALLTFSNMSGYYTVSRYNGDVRLDVSKKEIEINGRAPFYDVRDMLKVFSRRVKLPFTATGTGQAQIKASGPLALNKLSYDLRSSVFRGAVANETFDQASFDVKSVGGEVTAERVQLSKGASLITLTGTGHPDGTIKTLVQARGIRLEDSAIVSTSGLSISGLVDFDMDMKGPVLAPVTDLRGRLARTSIGDQGMPDSSFKLRFGSKSFEGEGDFLGDVVKAAFQIPFDPSAPFKLKAQTRSWNYAPLFAAIAGPSSRKDYEGRLTSTIQLASATGGFWNASGSIRLDEFSLSRGALALKSTEPIAMKMSNGQVHVEKFSLAGDNTFVKVTESAKPTSKLDLQVNGKLDMTLLGLLTPFLEDLRGLVSFAINVRGGPSSAELLGTAYVEKGYVKIFDFPHPIEDIRVDLLFNQKKIVLNTIKTEFGGGRVSGNGAIELKGPKNYPVSVTGQFEKVTVNVPENVRTSGSGSLAFSGSWFPFLLKVDYDVKEGLWAKEFGGDGQSSGSIRRDQFLPELLLQERFVPVVLDLNITFPKGVAIKNELVDGRATGQITVKGPPSKPSILGTVIMEKDTKITVKDTQFEVTTANIHFNDPNEINPKLHIAARSRVQEYDINLLIQGTGAKPDFGFTSVPPLANKDIISLLALGTTEASRNNPAFQASPGTQTQAGPGVNLGVVKNNPFSKEIKEKTGFDVQFAPGFDEQAAVNKIIVKRQFTNKFGLSGSQALGSKRSSDLEARYQLNDKISGVLSWQNKEEFNSVDKSQTEKDKNQFGLDLEYKFEFK